MSDEIQELVERLRAWQDLSGWANRGWDIPPSATAKLNEITGKAADALERLRRETIEECARVVDNHIFMERGEVYQALDAVRDAIRSMSTPERKP